jgi:hypothetical protein
MRWRKKNLKKETGHRFTQMNTDKCNKTFYPIFLCLPLMDSFRGLSVSDFIFLHFSIFSISP